MNRGRRLTEVLKQPQYRPLPVERQGLILFAGSKGHLDGVAEADVADYEQELFQFMDARYGEAVARLVSEKKIDDQLMADLTAAVAEFTAQFTATRKEAAA